MHVLVATASVHTTAAACDYLTPRLTTGDTVLVVTVEEEDLSGRDAGDAANVARTRLVGPTIETRTVDGDPATAIGRVAREADVDELVVGRHRGDPERAGAPPGSTVRALLADLDRPVVVVPV